MKTLALALLALAACDTGSFYLYTGNQFDPAHDCVSDLVALDVESGSDPGATCGAKCIVGPDGTAYASTMCGPEPAGTDVSGTNAQCAPALAALARQDFCLEGGTSTNPLDGAAE
ncbi:MAG TPA: hypothetical protein VGH28_01465 [Polyangiaceae bacterium]|jgi:hypothetical protein